MATLTLAPLTTAGFAPYGEVFAPAAVTTRADHVAALENRRPAAKPNLFLARSSVVTLPHAFTRMESHPFSSQSFAVFGDSTLVLAVALPDSAGQPDLATLRGFAAQGQGFSYHAGVWHLPVGCLGAAVPILGFMYEDGSPQDCVWAEVEPCSLAEA